jgi:hypothetical protein
MPRFVVILTALSWFTAAVPVSAESTKTETVSPLLQQDLPNVPGKTFTSVIVAFPPGGRATPVTVKHLCLPMCWKGVCAANWIMNPRARMKPDKAGPNRRARIIL